MAGAFMGKEIIKEIPRPESDKTPQDKFIEWIKKEIEVGEHPDEIIEDTVQKLKELGL